MTEFEKHKRDSNEWFSEPFYSRPHGYKLCLKVDANGCMGCMHVSVGSRLMWGQFDDHLSDNVCAPQVLEPIYAKLLQRSLEQAVSMATQSRSRPKTD